MRRVATILGWASEAAEALETLLVAADRNPCAERRDAVAGDLLGVRLTDLDDALGCLDLADQTSLLRTLDLVPEAEGLGEGLDILFRKELLDGLDVGVELLVRAEEDAHGEDVRGRDVRGRGAHGVRGRPG